MYGKIFGIATLLWIPLQAYKTMWRIDQSNQRTLETCGICKDLDFDDEMPVIWPYAYERGQAHLKCAQEIKDEWENLRDTLQRDHESDNSQILKDPEIEVCKRTILYARHRLVMRTVMHVIGKNKTIKEFAKEENGNQRLGAMFELIARAIVILRIKDNFHDPRLEKPVLLMSAYLTSEIWQSNAYLSLCEFSN